LRKSILIVFILVNIATLLIGCTESPSASQPDTTTTLPSSTPLTPQATEPTSNPTMSQTWQEAYAAFFKDSDDYSGLLDTWHHLPSSDCDGFYLRDFDNNSIPELIISFNDGCEIYVFTYLDTILHLFKRESLITQIYLPSNPSLAGIFCVSRMGATYYQYENGLVTETSVFEYPDTGGERVFTIVDQRLYDELEKADILVLQEINESGFVEMQTRAPSKDSQNERTTSASDTNKPASLENQQG